MVFHTSPHNIACCTSSSVFTDINQHEKDKDHPHAFYDRGYFFEREKKGLILGGNWDAPGVKFTNLLEYQALYRHIKGVEKWSLSRFANRMMKYMAMSNKESSGARYCFRGFDNPNEFIVHRETQIDSLIESIKDNGMLPTGGIECQNSNLDDISVNISRKGWMLFNNRGHHRLALAKILDIDLIPVQIIVWHKDNFI
jgi:hypothetical protein